MEWFVIAYIGLGVYSEIGRIFHKHPSLRPAYMSLLNSLFLKIIAFLVNVVIWPLHLIAMSRGKPL